jgi:sodium/hydrogen antiporter
MRRVVLVLVRSRSAAPPRSRRLIACFGPRGLSSLLLVLLPVFAAVPGAERLFTITCLVVLLSVVLHGGGIAWYLQRHTIAAEAPSPGPAAAGTPRARPIDRPSLADTAAHPTPARPVAAVRRPADEGARVPEKITIQEFRDLHRSGEPVVVLDVRTERSYRDDPNIGVGAIRMPPDDAVRLARERRLDMHATLVLYCA